MVGGRKRGSVRRNPLRKRHLRELRTDFVKYLVIFVLMGFSIAFVSGFLVAADSMMRAYDEGFAKYNIENGHFQTEKKMNPAQKKAIESRGVTLYDISFADVPLTNGSTLRIFSEREEVDRVCLMEGELPSGRGQIAVDRMYADNNGISAGDVLVSGNRSWRVTGLVALSDYSCLFEDNDDAMFDAVAFGVGVVPAEEFASLEQESVTPCYAWKYPEDPANEAAEKELADDLRDAVRAEVTLKAFVPRYQNQAIRFTGEDMQGDSVMMIVLL